MAKHPLFSRQKLIASIVGATLLAAVSIAVLLVANALGVNHRGWPVETLPWQQIIRQYPFHLALWFVVFFVGMLFQK